MASDITIEPIPGIVVQGTLTPDGRTLVLDEKLRLPAGRVRVRVDSMESPGAPRETLPDIERIVEARYVHPSQMYLRFADGLEGTWGVGQLGLSEVNVETAKASAAGDGVDVTTNAGENMQMDSPTLRALIDAKYAADLEKEIASRLIPSERLSRIAVKNQPPQEWYDSVEKP